MYAETLRALAAARRAERGERRMTPEVIVHRMYRCWPRRSRRAWSPGWSIRWRRGARPRWAAPEAASGLRCWPSWRPPRPGDADRLAAPGHLVGRRARSRPTGHRSGTRREHAAPCSTRWTPIRPGCIRCRGRTGRTAMIRRRRRPGTRRGCRPRPGPRITARSRSSTSLDARHRPRGPCRIVCSRGMPALYDNAAGGGGPGFTEAAADPARPSRCRRSRPRGRSGSWPRARRSRRDRAGPVRRLPVQVPAAGRRGWQRTLFLIDSAAAAKVPPQTGRQGSH